MWSKSALSQQVRDGSMTWKIRNTLQSLHIPDFVCDWDVGYGNVQSHKKRWRRTLIEISVMIFIQWVFNMILVTLIYIAGSVLFIDRTLLCANLILLIILNVSQVLRLGLAMS